VASPSNPPPHSGVKIINVASLSGPPPHRGVPDNGRGDSNRIQLNIFKTMIIVSVSFVICWSPNQIYFLLANLPIFADYMSMDNEIWYVTMCVALFNICINPFIYAAKLEVVKLSIKKWGEYWRKIPQNIITVSGGVGKECLQTKLSQ